MKCIAPDILNTPLDGVNLHGRTLGAQLSAPVTLMVFLRHYDCIFCKEMVRDLRHAHEQIPGYPKVLFFGQGDFSQTLAFAAKLWPDMSIVSDSTRRFYDALGLDRGSIYQMFGPRVWACGIRAGLKLNFQGIPVGDIWTMPGIFAVNPTGTILWSHRFDHIADHPDWTTLPAQIASGTGQPDEPDAISPTLQVTAI